MYFGSFKYRTDITSKRLIVTYWLCTTVKMLRSKAPILCKMHLSINKKQYPGSSAQRLPRHEINPHLHFFFPSSWLVWHTVLDISLLSCHKALSRVWDNRRQVLVPSAPSTLQLCLVSFPNIWWKAANRMFIGGQATVPWFWVWDEKQRKKKGQYCRMLYSHSVTFAL